MSNPWSGASIMIELNVAGGVLILAGLAMLIWKREGDRKPNVPSTDILGVKVQGPVGLFVLIVGAACLVLANFQAVKDLVGNKDETAPRPVPVTTGASPAAQPPSNGGNNIFPADLAGTWTGVYEQSNGKSYRVELVITANLATAQVRYP